MRVCERSDTPLAIHVQGCPVDIIYLTWSTTQVNALLVAISLVKNVPHGRSLWRRTHHIVLLLRDTKSERTFASNFESTQKDQHRDNSSRVNCRFNTEVQPVCSTLNSSTIQTDRRLFIGALSACSAQHIPTVWDWRRQ